MVREYTNREVSRIMGASEEGHYRLIPIVTISRDQVRVRFTVGREKQYPVKDLTAFAKAMETMSLSSTEKGWRSITVFRLSMRRAGRWRFSSWNVSAF